MKYKNDNPEELLEFIDPALLDYQEWCNVGMALKDAGYDVSIWDKWSATDTARYKSGECQKKWKSFNGSENPVTFGTIVKMAIDNGYMYKSSSSGNGNPLEWDDIISEDYVVTSADETSAKPVIEPEKWNPVEQISKYIETLFETEDHVAYVTQSYQNESGKYLPSSSGNWDRTAGQLLAELSKYNDISKVFGDYNPEGGAWIKINPFDGKGCTNGNVTDFRYALVESDSIPLEQQNGIIHDLQLPAAALVYTGGKSIHAIVRVDAGNYDEYRKKVEFLYNVCDKNGLKIDRSNKNPSRLSRMPGVVRNGKKQFLMETNIGFSTWAEWKDYIDSITDNLPEFENMSAARENMPDLAPPLIENVLRQGHKMLIAGPSKAGKSYALIEMAAAIAEGRKWLGWQCAKGRVLYVNLELDRASCLHRFKDIYSALNIPAKNLDSIDIWNLRGVTEPMDRLAPKLIRRAKKRNYIAVIIDPIYKVITGDENSADQMAHFCNQFDKVCTQLECAVIYCHHHSKGSQGGKRSMDRASGSGVFARDPDALLDMTELELTEEIIKQLQNQEACRICSEFLRRFVPDIFENTSQDDLYSRNNMFNICHNNLPPEAFRRLECSLDESDMHTKQMTAWRLEGTLREFPKFEPKNLWFKYPYHQVDSVGILRDLQTDNELTGWQRGNKKRGQKTKETYAAKSVNDHVEILNTFDICNIDGMVTVQDMAEYLGVSEKTIRRKLKNCKSLFIEGSSIKRKG